jgi:hypothetical protein
MEMKWEANECCTAVAYDDDMHCMAVGDDSGAVRIIRHSGAGGEAAPRAPCLEEDRQRIAWKAAAGVETRSTTDAVLMGSWRFGREAIRGVRFASGGTVVVSVDRVGEVVAVDWPTCVIRWRRRILLSASPDSEVTAKPRAVHIGKIRDGVHKSTASVQVARAGGSGFRIHALEVAPRGLFTTEVKTVKDGSAYEVVIGLGAELMEGSNRAVLTIRTNDVLKSDVVVYLYAVVGSR